MKFSKNILFLLIFLIGFVSASSVTCVIVEDRVLVDVTLSEGANVILPEEYSLLERNGNEVSFISRDFLRNDGEWIFVLPRVVDSIYDLKVYLPYNYILSDELVYPKGYEISSDGKSIILSWDDLGEDEVIVFYEGDEDSNFGFWVLGLLLVFLGFGAWVLERKKGARIVKEMKGRVRRKIKVSKKELVSKNLFGDEKAIVEFLMERKSCWMKELVKELGVSKVRVSRKVRSLVEKGLVEKESFGRENRIRLVK